MYKRVILKLSGETLAPEKGREPSKGATATFDPVRVDRAAKAIVDLADLGVQVGVVMGGGNIWRGRFTDEMNPVLADQMGMLGTVINCLCVADALREEGLDAVVQSAVDMNRFAEPFNAMAARRHLSEGRVVLFACGTGNPFFTTDSGAALRALEIGADALLKGTRVDGVYTADPEKDPTAVKYDELTFDEAISKHLKVMDQTAYALCSDGNMPIIVFDMNATGNLTKLIKGEKVGTLVHP